MKERGIWSRNPAPAPGSASPPARGADGCGAARCDGRCRSEVPPKRCDSCHQGTCATWFGIDGLARCWACEVARG